MHQGQRRDDARVLKVKVVLADLIGEQQPLVNNGPRRHRRLVELLAVLEAQGTNGVGSAATDDIELALERVSDHHVGAAPDEDLADDWLTLTHRRRHRHRAVNRNVTPAEDNLPFGAYRTLDFLLTGQTRCRLLGKEDHADTVISRAREIHALRGHLGPEESVGNLNQDARTVPHQRVGTDGTAVIQIFQNQQPLVDDRMAFLAFDMRHETDAAGIVLIGPIVKPLLLG